MPHTVRSPALSLCLQNKLFGGLVGSAACTVQLELRSTGGAAGQQQRGSVSLRNNKRGGGEEAETTLPLFSSKDTISGEVGALCWGLAHLAAVAMCVGCMPSESMCVCVFWD